MNHGFICMSSHFRSTEEDLKVEKPARDECMRRKIKEFESRLSAVAGNLNVKHPVPPHLK